MSELEGGNATSLLGVHGGSDVWIHGQFGDVSYPESAAPVVYIGSTPCVVDLDDSTSTLTHCVTAPLVASDLEGRSGAFTLDLTLYTPQARQSDTGESVAAANQATCSVDGGCGVRFDLESSPRIDSIRTSSLSAGGVMRVGGGGLNSGDTDPEDYEGEDFEDERAKFGPAGPSGRRRLQLDGETESQFETKLENDGYLDGDDPALDYPKPAAKPETPTLQVKIKATTQGGRTSQCGTRDSNQDQDQTGQDDGNALGPNSDTEASCKIPTAAVAKASAGPYSLEVVQSEGNKGSALLNEADAKVDLVSGKRYHFELSARITSIAPILAPVHGGVPITIRGDGFGLNPSIIDVRLGTTPCPVDEIVEGGFTCNLAAGQDQFADTSTWEWPSERGVRWQWFYEASLGGSIKLSDAMNHSAFPDGSDGESRRPGLKAPERSSAKPPPPPPQHAYPSPLAFDLLPASLPPPSQYHVPMFDSCDVSAAAYGAASPPVGKQPRLAPDWLVRGTVDCGLRLLRPRG